MNNPAKCLSRCLAVALSLFLFPASGVAQTTAADNNCWPAGNLTFPAGSRDDVARKAAEFLIKAEAVTAHPYWPGGTSGVTLGVGWDAGYHSRAELRATWAMLGAPALALLDSAAGKKGREAQALIPSCARSTYRALFQSRFSTAPSQTIIIRWSSNSFQGLNDCRRKPRSSSFPSSLIAARRWGTIPIGRPPKKWTGALRCGGCKLTSRARNLCNLRHLGTMKRLWETAGPRGLPLRRRDEQALIRPYVNQQLKWEENRDKLKQAGLPPCAK